MPAQPVELGLVLDSLRRAGVEAPLIGGDVLAVPAILPVARREGDRLVLLLPWTGLEHASETNGSLAPPRDLAPTGQHDLAAARARTAAAIEAWAAAIRSTGSIEPAGIAAALRSAKVPTSVGPLGFDAAGDALVPSYLPHVWRDGAWRLLLR
jgi:ABC-type branched-subunit amino acid transport system substrate-binding protein